MVERGQPLRSIKLRLVVFFDGCCHFNSFQQVVVLLWKSEFAVIQLLSMCLGSGSKFPIVLYQISALLKQ